MDMFNKWALYDIMDLLVYLMIIQIERSPKAVEVAQT